MQLCTSVRHLSILLPCYLWTADEVMGSKVTWWHHRMMCCYINCFQRLLKKNNTQEYIHAFFSSKTLQIFIIFLHKILVYILWSAVHRRVNRLGVEENKKVFLLTVRWYCLHISGQAWKIKILISWEHETRCFTACWFWHNTVSTGVGHRKIRSLTERVCISASKTWLDSLIEFYTGLTHSLPLSESQ